MHRFLMLAPIFLFFTKILLAQKPPPYTVKHLVTVNDGTFRDLNTVKKDGRTSAIKDGKTIAYITVGTEVVDISDDNTSFIKIRGPFMLCFEGYSKNGKK